MVQITESIAPDQKAIEGFRLSPQQMRLWALQRCERYERYDGQNSYRSSCVLRIEGPLDNINLHRALHSVLGRHEVLRTTLVFNSDAGIPLQVIRSLEAMAGGRSDIISSEMTQREDSPSFNEFLRCRLDVENGPWQFIRIQALSATTHLMFLTYPAFCADALSLSNLAAEIAAAYAEPCFQKRERPLQYADVAEVFNELLTGPEAQAVKKHWRLQNLISASTLVLPFEKGPPVNQPFEPEILQCGLESRLQVQINQIAATLNCSTAHFFLACWRVLLCRLINEGQRTIGVACDGRTYDGFQSALGPYARFLPFDASAEGQASFSFMLAETVEVLRRITEWQDYFAWEHLAAPSGTEKKPAFFPICFESFDLPFFSLGNGPTFSVENLYSCPDRFKIKLSCRRRGEQLLLEFHYDCQLVDRRDIEGLAHQFLSLVESAALAPEAAIERLNILDSKGHQELLTNANATRIAYREDKLVHELIEEQARQTPDAIAVAFLDEHLTYFDLNACANQLSGFLRKHQVGPEARVGICMERSLEMVIAILGVLKSGGCYVPLDPDHPRERLHYLLEDAGIRVLLTQGKFKERLSYGGLMLALDSEWNRVAPESRENPENVLDAGNLVYLIYTSGSTGKPKGVLNVHRGCRNRILWMQQRYGLNSTDKVLQKTPFTFDVSVWEFLWPLMTGSQLVMAEPNGHRDSDYLIATIQRSQITTIHFVPAMLESLLSHEGIENCGNLRRVICSGEALGAELQRRFQSTLNVELHNLYGPTEASIDVTSWHCPTDWRWDYVPIGKPIANTSIYLLDPDLNPVPAWHLGELFIGGIGVARGYLGQPALTAECFVPDPFSAVPGARMYKTGDLARNDLEFCIRYAGRMDGQFKMRGFRIEPGEVESALCRHGLVREAVLMLAGNASSNQRLIAYITGKDEQPIVGEELFSFLEQRLPEYMLPSSIVLLDKLPLTANGKIDRKRLPSLMGTVLQHRKGVSPPRSVTEQALADIWRDLLGCRPVGFEDTFFDLGGHSLMIPKLLSRISSDFGVSLSVQSALQSPSLADLATAIDEAKAVL